MQLISPLIAKKKYILPWHTHTFLHIYIKISPASTSGEISKLLFDSLATLTPVALASKCFIVEPNSVACLLVHSPPPLSLYGWLFFLRQLFVSFTLSLSQRKEASVTAGTKNVSPPNTLLSKSNCLQTHFPTRLYAFRGWPGRAVISMGKQIFRNWTQDTTFLTVIFYTSDP